MTQDVDLQLQADRMELVNQIGHNMNELTAQYQHDERFKDILIRIRNFISKYFHQNLRDFPHQTALFNALHRT